MLKEDQKVEARKRIKALGMHPNVFKEFTQEGKLNKSETNMGILYWLDEEEDKIIRNWEKETDNLAYHVILNNTEFGMLLSIFYVSKHKEEWVMDNEDLAKGYSVVYVMNLDDDTYSEYGSISFESKFGGLVRVS